MLRGRMTAPRKRKRPRAHAPARLGTWKPTPLHENRYVPLYLHLEQLIRYRIANGEYVPGQQIPSEHELCRELNVSRVTVREAFRELVRDNLLVKAQGKGTFVAPNPPAGLPPLKYAGLLDELYGRVLTLAVKDVQLTRIPMTEPLRETLGHGPAERELVQIKRVRFANDEPFSFTINYLPVAIGDRVDAHALYRTPLLRMLEQDLNVPIVRAHETVEAMAADPEVATHLQIPLLYPVMHVKRLMYTDHDRIFEVVETYYRADKYQYSVELTRVHRGGKATWSAKATSAEPSTAAAGSRHR